MSEKITSANLLDKLRLHDKSETPAVCLIAGQEIERLRAQVQFFEARETYRQLLADDAVGGLYVSRRDIQAACEVMDEAASRVAFLTAKGQSHE